MATVALGLPIFAGNEEDDLERFIELYKGYIHSLGIDPSADGGPPTGWEKANGIFRACLTGPSAQWYDENILGKRVKLRNINVQVAQGNEGAFKALANNHANCANTWLNQAQVYANANAGNPVTEIWPDYTLEANDEIWRDRAGIEFTNDPLNYILAGGGVGGGGAGVGNPYVIPAHPCHILIKMRADLPIQQMARRQLRFGNLFQGDMPVRKFYDKIRRSATLLGYGNDIIINQFLRGLNDENAIEAERIGVERNIDELVTLLERVENRKKELRLGKNKQVSIRNAQNQYIDDLSRPVTTPQEPVILKPVTQHGISREDMDRLLNSQAETFQKQIRQLQHGLQSKRQKIPPVAKPITRRPRYDNDYIPEDPAPDFPENPFDDDDTTPEQHDELFRFASERPRVN